MKATRIARMYSMTKEGFALTALAFAFAATMVTLHADVSFKSNEAVAAESLDVPAAPRATVASEASESLPAHAGEQRALASFIAKRWRIAESAASRFVSIAYRAGHRYSVDPVLILAVMAVESAYNPIAESVVGAKGLMQVIPKFHLEKLASYGKGEEALLDPEVNINVGAQILRDYYRRLKDLPLALQMYGGAFDEPTLGYSSKVLAERARLQPIRERARKQSEQSA